MLCCAVKRCVACVVLCSAVLRCAVLMRQNWRWECSVVQYDDPGGQAWRKALKSWAESTTEVAKQGRKSDVRSMQ